MRRWWCTYVRRHRGIDPLSLDGMTWCGRCATVLEGGWE